MNLQNYKVATIKFEKKLKIFIGTSDIDKDITEKVMNVWEKISLLGFHDKEARGLIGDLFFESSERKLISVLSLVDGLVDDDIFNILLHVVQNINFDLSLPFVP